MIARQPNNFAKVYEIETSKEFTQSSVSVVTISNEMVTEPSCKLGFTPVIT